MRWINIVVSVVFVAAVLIFAIQNFQTVTVAFLSLRMSAPLAVLIIVIYLLGMVTGGSVWALIRWAIEGSKQPAVR
jgi:putative membrane protein